MNTAGKVHKTLRLDAGIAGKVKALQLDGETETALYSRVIAAGVEALRKPQEAPTAAQEAQAVPGAGDAGAAVIEALNSHIQTLKAVNEAQAEQLKVKDLQIESLTAITQASQTLHAMNSGTKALEGPKEQTEKKPSLWERIFG